MTFTNTGVMCVVLDGDRSIDLGNYFTTPNGNDCLITTIDKATKYAHLVEVPVYIRQGVER